MGLFSRGKKKTAQERQAEDMLANRNKRPALPSNKGSLPISEGSSTNETEIDEISKEIAFKLRRIDDIIKTFEENKWEDGLALSGDYADSSVVKNRHIMLDLERKKLHDEIKILQDKHLSLIFFQRVENHLLRERFRSNKIKTDDFIKWAFDYKYLRVLEKD